MGNFLNSKDGWLKSSDDIREKYCGEYMDPNHVDKNDFIWNTENYKYSKKQQIFDNILNYCKKNNYKIAVGKEYGTCINCGHCDNASIKSAFMPTCMFHIKFDEYGELNVLSDDTVRYYSNFYRQHQSGFDSGETSACVGFISTFDMIERIKNFSELHKNIGCG